MCEALVSRNFFSYFSLFGKIKTLSRIWWRDDSNRFVRGFTLVHSQCWLLVEEGFALDVSIFILYTFARQINSCNVCNAPAFTRATALFPYVRLPFVFCMCNKLRFVYAMIFLHTSTHFSDLPHTHRLSECCFFRCCSSVRLVQHSKRKQIQRNWLRAYAPDLFQGTVKCELNTSDSRKLGNAYNTCVQCAVCIVKSLFFLVRLPISSYSHFIFSAVFVW